MTTQTRIDTACRDCPSGDDLDRLVRGRLPEPRQVDLADHIGECPDCQARMESLATGGDARLSDVVRHIDKSGPPSDSAYWRALNRAEAGLTADFPADLGASGELKLDFLQPTDIPGRLGRLGSFEVIRVIGRGGMGIVLQAFDPDLSREVAIKLLDPQLANNEIARQRFCREARAAAAVTHDHLVAVHQVNEDESSGLPFLVMQLVVGESLEQRLKRVGRLGVAEAVRIGMQAAAGLAGAHAQGLIHRDIKPANILIEAGAEKVKLTDFGLARATEDLKLTRTGFVAGTPLYMAPEQARGDDVDARADLFSLGTVLYETLAGKPPFDGKTPLAVLRRVADEAHVPLHKINPDVPIWLEEAIDRLLAKEPADRFQTAAEVSELFAQHLACLGGLSPLESPAQPCGGSAATSHLTRKAQRHICYKTIGMLAGVFGVGVLLGGSAVWGFFPRTVTSGSPATAVAPGSINPSAAAAADEGPESRDVLKAEAGAVWSVALTKDGSTLVAGHETGRVSVWDVANRRLLYNLHEEKAELAHAGPVWAADITPDGTKVVTASDDGKVKVWDLSAEGKFERAIPVGRSIRSAALSPNGNWVAVGDRYGTVRVFDLKEESLKYEYDHGSTVNAVAFSPKPLMLSLASVGTDGTVVVTDLTQGGERGRKLVLTGRDGGHSGPAYGVGFSPDGDRLVTSGWDQKVIVWDLRNGSRVGTIEGAHADGVWAAQFAPCGKLIATVGQDGKTKVWDAETRELLATYGRHRGVVHTARFNKDSTVLATGGRDGTIRIWAVECHPK